MGEQKNENPPFNAFDEVRIFDADNPSPNGTALPPLSSGTMSLNAPFVREDSGNYILHWVDYHDSTLRRYDMTNTQELSNLSFPTGSLDDYPCLAFNR